MESLASDLWNGEVDEQHSLLPMTFHGQDEYHLTASTGDTKLARLVRIKWTRGESTASVLVKNLSIEDPQELHSLDSEANNAQSSNNVSADTGFKTSAIVLARLADDVLKSPDTVTLLQVQSPTYYNDPRLRVGIPAEVVHKLAFTPQELLEIESRAKEARHSSDPSQ